MKSFLPLALFLIATPLSAQTVVVTTGDDLIDIDPQTAVIADLPGPDGLVSFSEAMIATNNTPGHQTIAFNIPQSSWLLQFLYPGRAVLKTITGYYWRASDSVTIDGTTQTAFTGDTYADGNEVATYGPTIYLNADGCILRGFDSTAVSVTGSNGLVEGNTAMNIDVYGGSGSVIHGNTGGTIKIDRSSDNVVTGNTVQRVRVLGWIGGGQAASNNQIGGPTLAERNYITGYGTWSGEGYPGGTTVQLFDSTDTVIENNWIGTTPDGLAQGSQASTVGIGFEGENHNTVIRNNRIAGILGHGSYPHYQGILVGWSVLISGRGSNIDLVGNTIGLDANDQPLLGSVDGIDVGSMVTHPSTIAGIRIGGPLQGEGNVIAGHLRNGITIGKDVGQVRLQNTTFHDNGTLGIDLIESDYASGVTANDPLDADSGANGLQNFPVLDQATTQGSSLRLRGSLASSPLDEFSLEFFASPTASPSGHGEGQLRLGATRVTTDAVGDAVFDLSLPVSVPAGWVASATATLETLGATSEFSAALPIEGLSLRLLDDLVRGAPADLQVSGALNGENVTFLYSLAGTGAGSCPPPLGGLCLDLLAPVQILGTAAADASGIATFTGMVPASAPLVPVHFQAVVRRGTAGIDSVKTDALSATIQP